MSPVVVCNGVPQVQSVSLSVDLVVVCCLQYVPPSGWALQACSEGLQVEIVMSEFDIFVSSMGIITLDHMKSLKNITLDGNTGHFDEEIDLAGSEGFGHESSQQQASEDRLVFPAGHSVIVFSVQCSRSLIC